MVKRRTRSIFEEIKNIEVTKNREQFLQSKVENIIASISNMQNFIVESYDSATAEDLMKRLALSIKSQNPKKFQRGISKINEDQRHHKLRNSKKK